jgi:uroporphyrinogen decarboxylase
LAGKTGEASMNSRERFLVTMHYGTPDQVPLFEEGIRAEVRRVWRKQGLSAHTRLAKLFAYDEYTELAPRLYPPHSPLELAGLPDGLERLNHSLDADDPRRLPDELKSLRFLRNTSKRLLTCSFSNGLFQTLGIEDWRSFGQAMYLLSDQRLYCAAAMRSQGEFTARLARKIMGQVPLAAAVFEETVAGNSGPLVSPRMYREIALNSYAPIIAEVRECGVDTIILKSWANVRRLLPEAVAAGFNCLWAYERGSPEMDYLAIREEYGSELRLIGGIDLDVLRIDKNAIRNEVERVVPPLLAQGGYIPMLDGRVRIDITFENYTYYRRLLEEMVNK